MFDRLKARGEAIGRAAAADRAARLAAAVRETFPGIAAESDAAGVTLRGRGLWRRWLADPALRWLGGLLR
ncbi:hypothetical protein [Sphingomonas pokkalii]|uniref:Uncharacterized protein n=1 Tax=Sphingomonas pokkalii TaxID=2175090 RepID=A0A2U0SC96_9SPHN|nr:hypothetical protein [Sphingomonas pokkalii]PVX28993.1 hypothetical protein DD559_06305 [Sphingomonas pokkalii]